MNIPELSFEQAFLRLEEILEKINSGSVTLDQSLKYYEEADRLIASCSQRLQEAERKVEMLIKNRNGEVVVEVEGDIKSGGLERLNRVDHGFTFNGVLLSPAKVSWQSENRLRFALKGERPRQIAYFCESVGLRVQAMKRLRIGRVPMSGLQPGQWRYLLPHEKF